MDPGEAVRLRVGGQGVDVGEGEDLVGGVVDADHRGDLDLRRRDAVRVLQVRDGLDRGLAHLAGGAREHAVRGGRATEVHRHEVDRVVRQGRRLDRLHGGVAGAVQPAVRAVAGGQGREREREAHPRVLRLGEGCGAHQVLHVGGGLTALDVEVDADHVRGRVPGDERLQCGARALERTGGSAGADDVVHPGGVELRDVGVREGIRRDATPVLAAARAGREGEGDRLEAGLAGRHQAVARADHRDPRPGDRGVHDVRVPVEVHGDVLVRAEHQAAGRAAAPARARGRRSPTRRSGAAARAGAGAGRGPRLAAARRPGVRRGVVALRPPVRGVVRSVLADGGTAGVRGTGGPRGGARRCRGGGRCCGEGSAGDHCGDGGHEADPYSGVLVHTVLLSSAGRRRPAGGAQAVTFRKGIV